MRNETGHETETIYGEAEREKEKKNLCSFYSWTDTPAFPALPPPPPCKKECSRMNFTRQWSTYRLSPRQVLYNQPVLCAADSGQSAGSFLQQGHNRCIGHTVLLAPDSSSGSFIVHWKAHMSLIFTVKLSVRLSLFHHNYINLITVRKLQLHCLHRVAHGHASCKNMHEHACLFQ